MSARSKTLSDKLFEKLQLAIVDGSLPPGKKLNETELAERYGVSRVPLREAFRRLESRGLVIKRPRAGIRVAQLSLDELVELYQIRESLEGLACGLAARNMAADDIRELQNLLHHHQRQIEQSGGQSYIQSEGNLDFHYRIVKGSGNTKLEGLLLDELYHVIRMYRGQFSASEGRPQRALKEHIHIVEAIEARDAELAEMLMKRHIAAARINIEKMVDDKLENDKLENENTAN